MKNSVVDYIKRNASKRTSGMELVQVAILIAIAVVLGLIFKDRLKDFVDGVFDGLDKAHF